MPKIDYIGSICHEADIICIRETHLVENVTNDNKFIEGKYHFPVRNYILANFFNNAYFE